MKSFERDLIAGLSRGIAILVLALGPFALLQAQQAEQQPAYIQVRLVDVKPDSRERWEAGIQQIRDAYREAGQPYFHVYQRVTGSQGYTVIMLDPRMNDVTDPELPTAVTNRVTDSLQAVTVMTLAVYPRLSIFGGSVAPGNFMTVRVRQTAPQNQQTYFNWHANVFTPALREAGWDDLRMGRVISGGNVNTFVKFSYSDSLPENRTAVVNRIGAPLFLSFIATEQALSVMEEEFAYRFRSDLSYTAE